MKSNSESTKQLSIGIVGGGDVGRDLIRRLKEMNNIQIRYVADKNKTAPGMKLARENNLTTTNEIMNVITDSTLNLILEVTGVEDVFNTIKEHKPDTTKVISGEASYLIHNMIEEYRKFQNQLLQEVINHLNEIHGEIEKDSQKVNEFLGEIEKVTKNLNMLAVNASIEAARAGAEGSGFSVVAEEVKDLSEQSTDLVQNIKEINENVINLNSKITEVVAELESRDQ